MSYSRADIQDVLLFSERLLGALSRVDRQPPEESKRWQTCETVVGDLKDLLDRFCGSQEEDPLSDKLLAVRAALIKLCGAENFGSSGGELRIAGLLRHLGIELRDTYDERVGELRVAVDDFRSGTAVPASDDAETVESTGEERGSEEPQANFKDKRQKHDYKEFCQRLKEIGESGVDVPSLSALAKRLGVNRKVLNQRELRPIADQIVASSKQR